MLRRIIQTNTAPVVWCPFKMLRISYNFLWGLILSHKLGFRVLRVFGCQFNFGNGKTPWNFAQIFIDRF